MTVQQTSILSFKATLPTLSHKQAVMYEALKKVKAPVTDRELTKILGWPINTVTPRRGELEKLGYIEHADYTFDLETNRHTKTWRLTRRQ